MRLLIVEDDDGVAMVLRKILSKLPHSSIQQVKTWEEMKVCMRDEYFDVVLLDLGLPDSSSAQTHSQIRKLKMDHPNTAVCVITGQPYYTREQAQMAGADDFMNKEEAFGGSSLIQMVSSLFHKYSTRRPMERLDNQTSLLRQVTHATIEELNRE